MGMFFSGPTAWLAGAQVLKTYTPEQIKIFNPAAVAIKIDNVTVPIREIEAFLVKNSDPAPPASGPGIIDILKL